MSSSNKTFILVMYLLFKNDKKGGKYVRTPLDCIGLCPFFSFFLSPFKKKNVLFPTPLECIVLFPVFFIVIMEGEVENYCPYFLFVSLFFLSISVPRAYNNVRYSCT